MAKAAEKIEVQPQKNGWWFAHFRAGNGKIEWHTEAYETPADTSPQSRSRRVAIQAAKRMGKRMGGVRIVARPSGAKFVAGRPNDYEDVRG